MVLEQGGIDNRLVLWRFIDTEAFLADAGANRGDRKCGTSSPQLGCRMAGCDWAFARGFGARNFSLDGAHVAPLSRVQLSVPFW